MANEMPENMCDHSDEKKKKKKKEEEKEYDDYDDDDDEEEEEGEGEEEEQEKEVEGEEEMKTKVCYCVPSMGSSSSAEPAISLNPQQEEFTFSAVTNLQTSVQRTVMNLGLLGGSLLCVWYVCQGTLTVGDYVLFTAYVEQLMGPLGAFGNQYR